MARRLAVRLYWMWGRGWNYEQWSARGGVVKKLFDTADIVREAIYTVAIPP